MPIANYTTTIAPDKTAGEVQSLLAKAGATRIMTEFAQGAGGTHITGMSFMLRTEFGDRGFQLPIRTEGVLATFKRDRVEKRYLTEAQAERVAWRVAHAWLKAQLALIDAGMTSMDEVMFPWMLTASNQPAYQQWVAQQKAIEA